MYFVRHQPQNAVTRSIFIRIGGTGMDRERSEARLRPMSSPPEPSWVMPIRQQPMHGYCLGLLMPIERKSVEPMAAVTCTDTGCCKTPIVASFCWECALVGHGD